MFKFVTSLFWLFGFIDINEPNVSASSLILFPHLDRNGSKALEFYDFAILNLWWNKSILIVMKSIRPSIYLFKSIDFILFFMFESVLKLTVNFDDIKVIQDFLLCYKGWYTNAAQLPSLFFMLLFVIFFLIT